MLVGTRTNASTVALAVAVAAGLGCALAQDAEPSTSQRADTGGSRCTETIGAPTSDHLCVEAVAGRITDLDGRAITGVGATVCGYGQCLDVPLAADGSFRLALGQNMVPSAFALHVEVFENPFATVYLPLPTIHEGVGAYPQPVRVPRFTQNGPTLSEGASLGQTLAAGDVSLEVPRGAVLTPSVLDAGRALTFRSVGVPVYLAPPFAQGLRVVYALGPAGLRASVPLRVRLRNRLGLPRGAVVTLVTVGSELERPQFNAGAPVVLGRATVSADAMWIESAPGVGLRELLWVGVRTEP